MAIKSFLTDGQTVLKMVKSTDEDFAVRKQPAGHKGYARRTPTGKVSQVKEKPYTKQWATCKDCGVKMEPNNTGDTFPFLVSTVKYLKSPDKIGGKLVGMKRVRYGEEGGDTSKPCPDCNVRAGGYHHYGCDWERCPKCGGQLIGCNCNWEGVSKGYSKTPKTEDFAAKKKPYGHKQYQRVTPTGKVAQIPAKGVKPTKVKNKFVDSVLANDESSSDEELANHFVHEGAMPNKEQALKYIEENRDRLLKQSTPTATPKVRVYDNGGKTMDRYTVVLDYGKPEETYFFGMSDNAKSPQGFNQFSGAKTDGYEEGSHLGKKVKDFKTLPEQVQQAIQERMQDEEDVPRSTESVVQSPEESLVAPLVQNKTITPKEGKLLVENISRLEDEYKAETVQEVAKRLDRGEIEHGFDKAGFKDVTNFEKIIHKYGLAHHEKYIYKGYENRTDRSTDVWSGPGIKLITSGDPRRKGGYSHYIGIEGKKNIADKIFNDIKSLNDYGELEWGTSGYIGSPRDEDITSGDMKKIEEETVDPAKAEGIKDDKRLKDMGKK